MLTDSCLLPAQMGIASIVHMYVFPAKPYALMDDHFRGSVSVLGDYASVDCPPDFDEVRESERPTKLRLPQPDAGVKSGTAIKESVRDIVVTGGEYVRSLPHSNCSIIFYQSLIISSYINILETWNAN